MKRVEITLSPNNGVIAKVEYFDSSSAAPAPTYHLHERTLQKAINSFLSHACIEVTDLTTC